MLRIVPSSRKPRRRLRSAALRLEDGMADEGPLLCGCDEGDCLPCAGERPC